MVGLSPSQRWPGGGWEGQQQQQLHPKARDSAWAPAQRGAVGSTAPGALRAGSCGSWTAPCARLLLCDQTSWTLPFARLQPPHCVREAHTAACMQAADHQRSGGSAGAGPAAAMHHARDCHPAASRRPAQGAAGSCLPLSPHLHCPMHLGSPVLHQELVELANQACLSMRSQCEPSWELLLLPTNGLSACLCMPAVGHALQRRCDRHW